MLPLEGCYYSACYRGIKQEDCIFNDEEELKHFLAVSEDLKETFDFAFCLLLPGKTLYLPPLLYVKKFRNRGNKDGAVRAICNRRR